MALKTSPSPAAVATLEEAQSAVEEIVEQLKENLQAKCGIKVNELLQGGALGLGTTLPGRFDVDLIIYSEDVDAKEAEQAGYETWLSKIDKFFHSDEVLSESYHFVELTPHALQFTYDGVEVDLLLSPHWRRPGDLYKFLESIQPQNRYRFLSSSSKWQIQFIKQQSNQTQNFRREFIRRAKAWRDIKWPRCTSGMGRPKTYLLSLLVLYAYDSAQKRLGVFSTLSPETMAWQTTEELKSMVYNHTTIDIYWEQCYSLRQYPALVPSGVPRIIDPANPANNLYKTGIGRYSAYERHSDFEPGDGNWSIFKRSIHTLDLSKPVEHWV